MAADRFYVEFPVDNVINVNWDDDDDEEPPPPPPPGQPRAGSYGTGSILVLVPPGFIVGVPFGPDITAPFVGTFPDPETFIPDGGLEKAIYPPGSTIDAPDDGLIAISLTLNPQAILFTTQQLSFTLRDKDGNLAPNWWTVPMATGAPVVVKTYTISMDWDGSADPRDQVGLGMTHPLDGINLPVPKPLEPFIVLGSRKSGAASYSYDMQWKKWATHGAIPTEENQFDPDLGGPAILWWMTRRIDSAGKYGPWTAAAEFMGSTQIGFVGEFFTWHISAAIEPASLL